MSSGWQTGESMSELQSSAESVSGSHAETVAKPRNELEALVAENARLRDLIGPDELSYVALKLEMWRLRDSIVGMEAALGNATGRGLLLEREIANTTRAFQSFAAKHSTDRVHENLIAAAIQKTKSLRGRAGANG
jgi:hypothetical protein